MVMGVSRGVSTSKSNNIFRSHFGFFLYPPHSLVRPRQITPRTMPPKGPAFPKAAPGQSPADHMKKAQIIQSILDRRLVSDEPERVDCDRIGVSEWNRKGMPPNIPYVHRDLYPQIEKDGYKTDRPKPGYIIRFTTPTLLQKNVHHNQVISQGTSGVFPPICDGAMDSASLGSTHLTLTFRLARHRVVSHLTGKTFDEGCDPEFAKVVRKGHLYWILSEDTTQEEATQLSAYFNADQDQNQGTSEIEMMNHVSSVCRLIMKENTTTRAVTVAALIQRVQASSSVPVNTDTVGALATYVLAQGAGLLVDEVDNYHSVNVNPRELSITPQ